MQTTSADFSQYKTYNFFADAGPEATNYQSFFSQYMVAAISREMESRGYVKRDALESDGRAIRVRLTGKGADLVAAAAEMLLGPPLSPWVTLTSGGMW